jgi:hypothetical protein
MTIQGWKYVCLILISLVIGLAAGNGTEVAAANISDFVNISPYIEVESSYDDNVFAIAEDAALPDDAEKREDLSLSTRAGVGVDISLERPYLTLGLGMDYSFAYITYMENTELDDTQSELDFDMTFASKYEETVIGDRFKLTLKDMLSLIPLDDEEPMLPGNQAIRNDFKTGVDYKLFATRRMNFTVGYAYTRTDYFEDDPIDVATIPNYEDSSDLTQESQAHTGKVDVSYHLNSKLSYLLNYTYSNYIREENPGELVSANFSRHNILSGFRAKLTPRIHSNLKAGYGATSYETVDGLDQDDQSNFVAEANITANFAHQPLSTIGYRRYYTENDFGDTLLTDDIFGRIGFKVAQGLVINLSGDYIRESRDLLDDETSQILFGVDTEYQLFKNIKFLAGYNYRQKEFFEHGFVSQEDVEETSHIFSSGFQYQIGRYVLLKGMYSYTDKSSDASNREYSRNKFTASGKVIF